MTMIHIKDWVEFAPNHGVMVNEEALKASPEELYEAISTALSHMDDRDLMDACCGGQGPLKNFDDLPYEEYLALKQALDKIREANKGEYLILE